MTLFQFSQDTAFELDLLSRGVEQQSLWTIVLKLDLPVLILLFLRGGLGQQILNPSQD